MKRIWISSAIGSAVVVATGLWMHNRQTANHVIHTKRAAIPVVVQAVQQHVISNKLKAVGILQPKRQVNLAPQIAGQVTKISYQPGAYVIQDKLLVKLDDRIYRAKLQSSESALKLAEMNYQRLEQLMKSNAASEQMLDQSRATYQQAQAAVATNKTYLAQTELKAPFAGYMGPKTISIGDYVAAGQKITTLTDRSELKVTYHLPERYLTQLKLGQAVSIDVPNQSHQAITGQVIYISPVVDETTHSVTLQALVPNKKNILAPGLFVRVHQTTQVNDNALVIPQESIVPQITGPKVYIVQKGRALLKRVKTGNTLGENIEILKGLSAKDRVVVAGQQRLQDGMRVKEVQS
jgi:membrane fusion protein (multidrug efflux system)